MSQHRCIEAADKALQGKNTRLTQAMEFPSGRMCLVIQTEIVQKKRGAQPLRVVATYCPFCGEKWERGGS